MVDKTFTDAEIEAQGDSYALTGNERIGMDTDPADTTGVKNYGAKLSDVSTLFADLGNQIEVIPGGIDGRAKVVSMVSGGTLNISQTIDISDKFLRHGLTNFRVTVYWAKDTANSAMSVNMNFGQSGNTAQFKTFDETDPTVLTGKVVGEFYLTSDAFIICENGVLPAASPVGSGTPVEIVIATNAPSDSQAVRYTLVEAVESTPAQSEIGLAEFEALKHIWLPGGIVSNLKWPSARGTVDMQLDSVAPFFISDGSLVSVDLSLVPTPTVGGAFTVPEPSKTFMVIASVTTGAGGEWRFGNPGGTAARDTIQFSSNTGSYVYTTNAVNGAGGFWLADQTIAADIACIGIVVDPDLPNGVHQRFIIDADGTEYYTDSTDPSAGNDFAVGTTTFENVLDPAYVLPGSGPFDAKGIQIYSFVTPPSVEEFQKACRWANDNYEFGPYPGFHSDK